MASSLNRLVQDKPENKGVKNFIIDPEFDPYVNFHNMKNDLIKKK